MNYLTNHYKQLAEQLQKRVNELQKQISLLEENKKSEPVMRTKDEVQDASTYDIWSNSKDRKYSTKEDKLAGDLSKVGYSRSGAVEMRSYDKAEGGNKTSEEIQKGVRRNMPPIVANQGWDYAQRQYYSEEAKKQEKPLAEPSTKEGSDAKRVPLDIKTKKTDPKEEKEKVEKEDMVMKEESSVGYTLESSIRAILEGKKKYGGKRERDYDKVRAEDRKKKIKQAQEEDASDEGID